MRLTTLRSSQGARVGALDEQADLIRLLEPGRTMLDVITGGDDVRAELDRMPAGADCVAVEDAVHGPLIAPPSVRDFLTYEVHLAALAGAVPEEWYAQPLF